MPSKTRSIGHLSIGHGTRVAANQNRKSLTTLLIAIPDFINRESKSLNRCPPGNAAELAHTIAESKNFIKECKVHNKYLTHYSTADAARDMDVLRQALGDAKLNYMGKSYGTFMGTLYAQLFPDNVGRIVLDGAVDPSVSNYQQSLVQAIGFDTALNAFIADCLTRSNCPLPKTKSSATLNFSKVTSEILKLFASAANKPLPRKKVKGYTREATELILVLGTASALYDNVDGWPKLRTAIKQAQNGYGGTFLDLADAYMGRMPAGTYSNNEFDSGAVINCLDFKDARTNEQLESDAQAFAAKAPVFGSYLAYSGLTCKYFPQPQSRVAVTTTHTSAPVIIIGTTRNPATPYAWAVGLHKILTNSKLISLNADGHTGHGRGSACVDDAVDTFYLQGKVPEKDLAPASFSRKLMSFWGTWFDSFDKNRQRPR